MVAGACGAFCSANEREAMDACGQACKRLRSSFGNELCLDRLQNRFFGIMVCLRFWRSKRSNWQNTVLCAARAASGRHAFTRRNLRR